ncbi:MAG: hypothetical protein U5L45_11100 [Saprospiraceae bacterium]|nr:hypothetical protein [Saprospiraceae bacterium]
MVHFSGFARKMNHLSYFCTSEASAKVSFNAYFELIHRIFGTIFDIK